MGTSLPSSASGGGNVTAKMSDERTSNLSNIVEKHLRQIFNSISAGRPSIDDAQLRNFFSTVQHSEPPSYLLNRPAETPLTYARFSRYVHSPEFTALKPPVPHDLSHPLPSYFISSSHNTYLSGNQLYSKCDAEAYKNVLLRGCRCVEVDVWDGEKGSSPEKSLTPPLHRHASTGLLGRLHSRSRADTDKAVVAITEGVEQSELEESRMPRPWRASADEMIEPQVMHAVGGQTLTKKITFRAVCQTIKENAFVTSDLPVIVSLEVHANKEQQQVMVDIMNEHWKDHLVHGDDDELHDLDRIGTELPTPAQLRNKILVKVKYVKPDAAASDLHPVSSSGTTPSTHSHPSSQDESSSNGHSKKTLPKPSKIIPALGALGTYTRSYKFLSLSQPEARLPAHVFSVSESDVLKLHNEQGSALSDHNRHFLMRVYPGGKRIGSSNLDPSVLWRRGAQMVALNWQNCDEGMMLNEGMFAGEGGWVYKPPGYNDDDEGGLPVKRYSLDLTLELFAAQNIPLRGDGKGEWGFHPYVTCELHVERPEEREHRMTEASLHSTDGGGDQKRRSQAKKGCSPDFEREVLAFKNVPAVVPQLTFLRVKVKDRELGKDSLAAWACVRLDRLGAGYRFLKLLDHSGQESAGTVLVRVTADLRPEGSS